MKPSTARNLNPVSDNGKKNFEPGRALYQRVRGGLIARGTHLKGWCREKGVSESSARAALFGFTDSDEAKRIRASLIAAAGLMEGD